MISLVIIYGLIIGSFLNVCIYRIPRDESVVFKPSHCIKCNKKICFYDNIPVVSYLILKGKCRNCGERLSIEYPIVELLNASIYVILFKYYSLSINFLFLSSIMSILIVVSFIDFKSMIIPDKLIITIIVFEILHKTILLYLGYEVYLLNSILAAILSGSLFLMIMIISKGAMGDGDTVLIASLGFILGLRLIFLNIFLSFLLGAFISILLLLLKIKNKRDPIAFAPFIIISFFIVLLFGEKMIEGYLKLFI